MLFQNKKKYYMDTKAADATLQSVFAACDKKPNEMPFDKIVLKNKMTSRACNTCIIICSIMILFTFVTPLLFERPHTAVSGQTSEGITLLSHSVENNELKLVFSSDDIEPANCKMVLILSNSFETGTYDALSVDKNTGTVIFPYFDEPMSIYVETTGGCHMTMIVTPK